MATRDYVKSPQARPNKRKKNNKRNGKQQRPPWGKMLISLLVLILFVFGLYRLSGIHVTDNKNLTEKSEENNESLQTNEQPTILEAESILEEEILKPLAPLPVLAEEEWEYIDSLPDFEVQVDATGPLESDKDFIMQCGSFRTQERAEELKAQIAFQGLESRILTSTGRNGLWYRVVLGPYDKKRNAERHRHQLRKSEIRGCKIW